MKTASLTVGGVTVAVKAKSILANNGVRAKQAEAEMATSLSSSSYHLDTQIRESL